MPSMGYALRHSVPTRATGPTEQDRRNGSRSIEAVLRTLPSHGWTSGWVGRRDRALLVLWQRAGLSFAEIATLTVDDILVEQGVASIRTGAGDPVTLRMTEDCQQCGPCALARWLHALDLSSLHSDGRVVASVIARAAPLTAHSPHVCEGSRVGAQEIGALPVFPEHDRWATSASAPPLQRGPTHDLRRRSTAHGGSRSGTDVRSGPDHAPAESTPAPVDQPTALENRARAVMAGLS